MTLSLVILPGAYFLLFLVWVALTLGNVYHVVRYAYWTRMPLVLVFVYLLLSASVLFATGWFLRDVDWQDDIQFSAPEITIPDNLPDFQSDQTTTDSLTP